MKKKYKVLLCYLIACLCLTLAANPAARGNPHIPLADSTLFYLFISPIYAPFLVSFSFFEIYMADHPPSVIERFKSFGFNLLVFAVPLTISLAVAFRRLPIMTWLAVARSTKEELTKRSDFEGRDKGH